MGLIFGEIIEVVGILPLKKNDFNIWIEETPWLISSMIFEGECLIFINQWNSETCIFKTLMNQPLSIYIKINDKAQSYSFVEFFLK